MMTNVDSAVGTERRGTNKRRESKVAKPQQKTEATRCFTQREMWVGLRKQRGVEAPRDQQLWEDSLLLGLKG